MTSPQKTILVIDDDRSILSVFEFVLEQNRYQVITASDAEFGLSLLNANPHVDLVFLDVKMPGMSGIEAFKEIQKTRPDLLVVMMTGYSVDELLREAFELGAHGVIYKPFDVEEIVSVVDKIFKLPSPIESLS
jgi:two-component system nitrogen regulation response regulator GlnG